MNARLIYVMGPSGAGKDSVLGWLREHLPAEMPVHWARRTITRPASAGGEAHEAIDFMLLDNTMGVTHNEGGARVVIEEFLQGEEASFIVLCDGKHVLTLATSQDHKRVGDGDTGPNTGGMGAYSPAPVVTPDVHARAMREIILPTIRGMEKDGIPYTGFLYAGLMISPEGAVKTLEFNCRMGDPETQPIMMRLKSDLVDVMLAATSGELDKTELEWDRRTALGVVLAAHGYPLNPRKGDVITGLPNDTSDAMVFHAGQPADDQCLRPSAMESRHAERIGDQKPDHTQHDAIGLAVMGVEGEGRRAHDDGPGRAHPERLA